MKSLIVPLLLSLACPLVSVTANTPVTSSQAPAYTEAEVLARLDAIKIPQVSFKGVPLSLVLAELQAATGEDTPIQFRMLGQTTYDPKVNLELRNLSIAQILTFACQQVNCHWSAKGGVVWVQPADAMAGENVSSDGLVTEVYPVARATVIRLTGFRDSGGSAGGPVDPFAAPSSGGSGSATTITTFGYSAPLVPPVDQSSNVASSEFNTESYGCIVDNPFRSPTVAPLSTFSIDVDTASYANVRRYLDAGQLPPADGVRIEELINYFPYDYEAPELVDGADADETDIQQLVSDPFAVHTELGPAFWKPEHKLLKIGLKGHEVDWSKRPSANLIFLLDVSGSMSSADKLPLAVDALEMLTKKLDARDTVGIVVYAGASGLALPPTTANNQETIQHALQNLKAGGSTNGGEGIELAYKLAKEHFIEDGVNRLILCTDGDFNVGASDTGSLTRLIEEKAKTGVFLSVFGFGSGNLNDEMMEELSNKGNGNYGYIDTKAEARKAFVQGAGGTMLTIAKDVKIQVEFNPAKVKAYRLIGYENRVMAAEDFNDDTKDAGELGSGHTVTALYEIAPVGSDIVIPGVDELKYQAPAASVDSGDELATVKLRYKWPKDTSSQLLEHVVTDTDVEFMECSEDFRFAASVAGWGMLLRDSPHRANTNLSELQSIAEAARGNDPGGFRSQYIELLDSSAKLLQED